MFLNNLSFENFMHKNYNYITATPPSHNPLCPSSQIHELLLNYPCYIYVCMYVKTHTDSPKPQVYSVLFPQIIIE